MSILGEFHSDYIEGSTRPSPRTATTSFGR